MSIETQSKSFFSYGGFSPRIADDVFVAPTANIIGNVEIGAGSSVWFCTVIRGDEGLIAIGERSNLQDGAIIHCNAGDAVTIGDNVTIGHGAIIHGCTIHSGVLVGMGAVVLDNAVVESGAQIAAGAVVGPGKLVPAGTLWGGVSCATNAGAWRRIINRHFSCRRWLPLKITTLSFG